MKNLHTNVTKIWRDSYNGQPVFIGSFCELYSTAYLALYLTKSFVVRYICKIILHTYLFGSTK